MRSPELGNMALEKGCGETSHVVWMKLGDLKDRELKPIILEANWNSVDFPRVERKAGNEGASADVAIHAGLICLNGPPGMDLDMQIELFEQALAELDDDDDDLVNQMLEIPLDGEEEIRVLRYALPNEYRRREGNHARAGKTIDRLYKH
ncbi:hypothetical protein QO004_004103 [Rhizobium mesoamericanum]|uniref:hypothetical protein n=1 Tax=Rhizobium mesoamericanum TaxID=1079800 RepID=UPI0027823024|nr:hypothetical protein [Rhizobium mesoamericanum]MDQ0562298.1 hypothetical protein [Rhizobium mesoamericanum]